MLEAPDGTSVVGDTLDCAGAGPDRRDHARLRGGDRAQMTMLSAGGRPMGFKAFTFGHGQRADWDSITHVRLTGRPADSAAGRRMVEHIASIATAKGEDVLSIAEIVPGFPVRQPGRGHRTAMQSDLRALANRRESGSIDQDKGLLEHGRLI